MDTTTKYLLSKEAAEKKLVRMALEVAERNYGEQQLVLVGIKESGSLIADKIAAHLKENFSGEVIIVSLLIDKKMPGAITLQPAIDVSNKVVLLIDDVANSGRVMLYALTPVATVSQKNTNIGAGRAYPQIISHRIRLCGRFLLNYLE